MYKLQNRPSIYSRVDLNKKQKWKQNKVDGVELEKQKKFNKSRLNKWAFLHSKNYRC